MIKGGFGGANTKTGLSFEGKVDFLTFISSQKDYSVDGHEIFYKGERVAFSYKQRSFYTYLESVGIDYSKYISKRLYPDDSIFVIVNNTIFIIEIKYQGMEGSVDEKLQTCDFKIKQYRKLLSTLNIEVQFVYILNDWFKNPKYKDVLDYIISIEGCSYYFNYLPLSRMGLPVPEVSN